MEEKKVKNLMVPLCEYATVRQTASMLEAVVALDESSKKGYNKSPHRAVLVMDEKGRIIGKLSQMDVIRSLEPKYREIGEFARLTSYGFSRTFIRNMQKSYNLWHHPSKSLADVASKTSVADIMYTPSEGEFVSEDSNLREAIHQLIVGQHQSLLVLRDKEVVGVLRFNDIFAEVVHMILG
jgi:CBS domain-containing protein